MLSSVTGALPLGLPSSVTRTLSELSMLVTDSDPQSAPSTIVRSPRAPRTLYAALPRLASVSTT